MTESVGNQITPRAQALFCRADAGGGVQTKPLTPIERCAETCAADWQIILHLRGLFEFNPALVSTLMADAGKGAPPGYAETLLVAAKEALAERPDSVELHLHTAAAAAHCGRVAEAESVLRRLLTLAPDHAGALAMLAEAQASHPEHERIDNAAEASINVVDEFARATLGRHGRRGNELPS